MIIRGSGNVVHLHISIHTTRKVVTINLPVIIAGCGFQSTPPARWWLKYREENTPALPFQSTPPARWWRELRLLRAWLLYFNPHHPQGGDMDEVLKTELIRISIHTTRKVVTMTWPVVDICLLFQSTPPARWWPRSSIQWYSPEISIHTTRKVVTCFCFYHGNALWFQSTPPARWWQPGQGRELY